MSRATSRPFNPYTAALLRQTERVQALAPASTNSDAPSVPERVQAFFDSMEINHGGNRARVGTGIAHTMSRGEIDDAIRRLEADQNRRADHLQSLGAPEVIVTNERRKYAPSITLLQRIRLKRPE